MERPAGAMPSPKCDAGQDRRSTRTVFRDGAAGPDDLNRVHEEGVSGRARTRVHRSSDQRNRASREAGRLKRVVDGRCDRRRNANAATESPIRIRPLHRLRRSRRTTQRRDTAFRASEKKPRRSRQAQWGPTAMSAPVLRLMLWQSSDGLCSVPGLGYPASQTVAEGSPKASLACGLPGHAQQQGIA